MPAKAKLNINSKDIELPPSEPTSYIILSSKKVIAEKVKDPPNTHLKATSPPNSDPPNTAEYNIPKTRNRPALTDESNPFPSLPDSNPSKDE